MKIGVFGSAVGTEEEVMEKAREIGRQIAKHGHVVITGGCTGLPHEAAMGANEFGGKCIAYSPAKDIAGHKSYGMPADGFSEFIFMPASYKHINNKLVCMKYRNVSSVADCDAVIIIGGRIGTMNEFTIAYDTGKNIGILEGTGGITKDIIPALLKSSNKPSASKIIWDTDPASLVKKLISL